jgi:hypothetical protein
MNITRILLLRAFLLITLLILLVCLTYGTEGRSSVVHIVRNVAWNDFIIQIKFLPLDSPQDSIGKEMLVIQRFLKEHETETNVGVYDLACSARSKRSETNCPTRKNKKSSGGDLWNPAQSSSAPNVSSQLSRERAWVSSASRFRGRKAITSSTTGFERGTAGKAM